MLMYDIWIWLKAACSSGQRLPNRGDLNTLLLLQYFSVGVEVFKNINSVLWFIHSGVDMVTLLVCCCFYSILLYTTLASVLPQKNGLVVLYDFLLTDKFCFVMTVSQIWCRNISKEVKGLCSRVALLSCTTVNHPHVMFAFLTGIHTHTHTLLMKESAYNRFCAWMLVQVPLGKPWRSPSRSCGQLFCQQKELRGVKMEKICLTLYTSVCQLWLCFLNKLL